MKVGEASDSEADMAGNSLGGVVCEARSAS